jgi:hypothetical protein
MRRMTHERDVVRGAAPWYWHLHSWLPTRDVGRVNVSNSHVPVLGGPGSSLRG